MQKEDSILKSHMAKKINEILCISMLLYLNFSHSKIQSV